ncbi:MAG TPA: [FeFe] hydrogenase H-cluster radical SAM maturase HydG [Thermoanaerobaculaceae bacterium]|nr:[FeFe] hydrogenase H-cluster radical SAM maturase HydG [Thermoanaerobaculaceae bacterium]
MSTAATSIHIDDSRITTALEAGRRHDGPRVRAILSKGLELHGLGESEMAVLMNISDPELLGELFHAARAVKERIYGNRLVIFAPLYISNMCCNECTYCAFRARNRDLKRRALTQEEIAHEVTHLVEEGHKRILMVAGESYPNEGFSYVLHSIETIYKTTSGRGEIRRVNVNIAPLDADEFRQLKDAQIGTYQLFQETYHRPTYSRVHLGGRKVDYDWRITAMDRAMEAGIDDVGVGVLFGLADWRYELLAMMQHIEHLERTFGVGPHTISVPRMEPASGSDVASHPPQPVPDTEFRKLVAILRLAVPYTGIIMSTRETAQMRRETFALGVSQISAGSRTNPGGYAEEERYDASQFSLGDHRPLDEVVRDVAALGYVPSFCTACYRLGRTGADFMDLAKPGEIKDHCQPNALATFQEYLEDYGSPETRAAGEKMIRDTVGGMDEAIRIKTETMLEAVRSGRRDVFC